MVYRLLIASGNIFERKIIRHMVKKYFADIEILRDATNGEEAIKLCREFKPDLMIVDNEMHPKSGLEAQEVIVKLLPDIKTIVVSEFDNFEVIQKAIKLRAADYILKPLNTKELMESICRVISELKSEENVSRLLINR